MKPTMAAMTLLCPRTISLLKITLQVWLSNKWPFGVPILALLIFLLVRLDKIIMSKIFYLYLPQWLRFLFVEILSLPLQAVKGLDCICFQ